MDNDQKSQEAPMFENLGDMQKFAKANIDASMKSFDLLAKNFQTIATEMTDYTKRSFENGTKTFEKLVGAKSLDKAIEVQSEYAKAACEDYFAEATKVSQLCIDLGKEALKPYEGLMERTRTS
jgi:hypothetical protein